MSQILEKIINLGENRDLKTLQEYVASLDIKQITKLLNDQICLRNSANLWNYLLQSFTESTESHEKRIQVVNYTLELMDKNDVSNTTCNSVMTRLCIELPKFKTDNLISMCEACVDRINKGTSSTWWRDLLPEILSILDERNTGFDRGISGAEFKKEVIKSLCDRYTQWSPNIATTLASMFCDLTLTKDEHLQIVIKLGGCIEQMTCQEVPAFVYQILRLCRTQNSRAFFFRLEKYFTKRIHNKLVITKDPTSDTTDLEDIVGSTEQDAIQAESTVLYHIHNSTSIGNSSIKDYLTISKLLFRSPEIILHPFQMTVLLTVSTIIIYEEQVFEILRGSVSRMVHEEFMKMDSMWFREMLEHSVEIDSVFQYIIDNNLRERELIVEGLINFSFILLNTGAALGSQHVAKRMWQIGTQILLRLMKKKREASGTILQHVSNRIVTGMNVPQLTDCLHQMCRSMTLILLENQSVIIQMIEQFLLISPNSSKLIIDSILPLIKVSSAVRDNLILILRKALYSKNIEIRQMAVIGFLKLVTNLKVSNLAAMSQSSGSTSSCHSLLTQISLDCRAQASTNRFGNEALCLEVLGILRRCFMQQAEVRSQLYEGLYDAVCMNSELGVPVLDILWLHFSQFYEYDEEKIPPLDFTKICTTKNLNVELLEPIGQLIFVVGLIVNKLTESVEEDMELNPSIVRFTKVLDSLCTRMSKCELMHFELDDATELLDNVPESQIKLITLKQIISIYEALMGYNICSWGPKFQTAGKTINSLFVCYTRLTDFLKDLNKPKKAEGRKKTETTVVDEENSTIDKSKSKVKNVKCPPTILDFQTIGKMLNLLHNNSVSWANSAQISILKVKCEFHRYILNVAIQLVQDFKQKDTVELKYNKCYYSYCTEIACTIYEYVIQRIDHIMDFDCTTAVLSVELFYLVLQFVVNNHKSHLVSFLSVMGIMDKEEELDVHLVPFIETFQKLFREKDEDDEITENTEFKKLPMLYINIFSLFVNQLSQNGQHAIKVLEWLTEYTENNTASNKQLANALIALQLSLHTRCKSSGNIFENVAIKLCNIMGSINQEKPECPVTLTMVNEGTAFPTLQALASTLKKSLDDVNWLIQRCRAEYTLISSPGFDRRDKRKEQLHPKESAICSHLCLVINVCKWYCNLTVPTGPNSEALLKIILQLYCTLNSLTKYFVVTSTIDKISFQSARFEQVVIITGKQLSPVVYDLILFIEESQQPQGETTQKKSNSTVSKSKVLKDTKLIPKIVYEVEQFGKNVTQLTNKTKVDLVKHVGPGTMRDFRIKAPLLDTALQELRSGKKNSDSDETLIEEEMEVDTSVQSTDKSDHENVPPKKKRKTK